MRDAWLILLTAVLTLAGTLLAQWSSLTYQTRRQRESKRADFQRTTLLQLREQLGELTDVISRLFITRQEALERAGGWDMLANHHPDLEAVRRVAGRLLLLDTALDDEGLRGYVASLIESAMLAAGAATADAADEHRKEMTQLKAKAALSLGKQLRSLP
jgi:hypothetical protein